MSNETTDPAVKAKVLRELHDGPLLVLPNAWDAASAEVVVESGFPVVATSSNAVAAMLGYPDGEGAPWAALFEVARRIARTVPVPVTVDAEAGYGLGPAEFVERLLDTGAVGCNLEDTDHRAGGLRDAAAQADYLAGVRAAATEAGVPIVINARVDTFLPTSGLAEPDRLAECLSRAELYRAAGADCVYPIGLADPEMIKALVEQVAAPINGNTGEALGLRDLADLGVRRVSYGPRFYRAALTNFRNRLTSLTSA
ncbi:isocitrate lyase/PEP mutase family protein [Microlunatus speluncae]|uniref:isocitrate lyase/PEP mutase family protein n=1 Tax=Microlunatus speluncae TaxID=2594267 RepID=UPI0012665AD4|nr:isocitrate lyase/phosphoenolpyruvate mutase family protein [Microlunatus speluncae]